MKEKSPFSLSRWVSSLTIFAFVFTQSIPVWALPVQQVESASDHLRTITPAESVSSRGLANALATDAAVAGLEGLEEPVITEARRILRQELEFDDLGDFAQNGAVPPEVVAATWAAMQAFALADGALEDQVVAALTIFATLADVDPADLELPSVAAGIQSIAQQAPHDCATCGAQGLHSLASEARYGSADALQSLNFQSAETITAMMIAADFWATGEVHAVDTGEYAHAPEPAESHRVFGNTLATLQALYNAAELSVEVGQRREWLPRQFNLRQLQRRASEYPMTVHLGGNHFARIIETTDDEVTLTHVRLGSDSDAPETITIPWADFDARWSGDQTHGYALVGVPMNQAAKPGRDAGRAAHNIVGCCGVSNASGIEGLFARATASQRIVRVLESRGFDNYATARKMRLELPEDFSMADNEALQAYIQRAADTGKGDILFIESNANGRPELRFFATSRGVGSATANQDTINRDVTQRVSEIAKLVYGDQVQVRAGSYSGHVHILTNALYRLGTVEELGVADHTRFKTKGDDSPENAHHGGWKGISFGFNGDWNDFEPFKAILQTDRGEPFFGNADVEPLEHIVGNLSENRNPSNAAEVIGYVGSEVAVQRTLRLLENMTALLRASEVLQPGYAQQGEQAAADQKAVRAALGELGIDAERLAQREQVGSVSEVGEQVVSVLVREMFNRYMDQPQLLDQEATDANDWQGYYPWLGTTLPQTHDKVFNNPKTINISMNLLSLHDDHSAVVARTYDKSTAFSFGFGRDRDGNIVQILGGSEVRGFAPLIGTYEPENVFPIREDIVDMVNGKVEQTPAEAWSVYTVDQTTLTRHDVWTGTVDENIEGEELDVKWTHVHAGKERAMAEWTRFRLETGAQPITAQFTLSALTQDTQSGGAEPYLPEATDKTGADALNTALANPDTKIFGGASGTSMHALLLVNAMYGMFDRVTSSDEWNSTLPRNLIAEEVAAGRPPVFVIVSQSGETGAAKDLILELADLGALVIGVTNRPGSSVYRYAIDRSSGAIVTQSIDEEAVAATGSNTSQVIALELLAMKRKLALSTRKKQTKQENSDRIAAMKQLTTFRDTSGLHEGVMQAVLDSFEPGQGNHAAVAKLSSFLKKKKTSGDAGQEEELFDVDNMTSFRGTNVILLGMGDVASQVSKEHTLKVMEVTRKEGSNVAPQELLAYNVQGTNPQQRQTEWTGDQVAPTIQENLVRYTTGLSNALGNYVHFGTNLLRTDERLSSASEVLLLGDGEDMPSMGYAVNEYQSISSVPVKNAFYADAPEEVRKNALVVMLQPWAEEHGELMLSYEQQGATVVVIGSESDTRGLRPENKTAAEQAGTFIPVLGAERTIGQTVVLDLFMTRLMEAKRIQGDGYNFTDPTYLRHRVERLTEQIEGVQVVSASFADAGHRNAVNLKRWQTHAKKRGWKEFEWWATGKGSRLALARDLALRNASRTGKMMETADTSEFKHGRNAATAYGDAFVNYWPRQGTPDWDDAKKTVIYEAIPRLANYPYPIFADKEPGVIILIAAENADDPYLRHLNGGEYGKLRSQRRKGGVSEQTYRPDIVFVTPHGGFLEEMVLNRHLAQGMGAQITEEIEQDGNWQNVVPRNTLLLVDTGETFDGKAQLYQQLRDNFPADSDHNFVLAVAPNGTALADRHSDAVVNLPTEDPLAFLVAGHQLTTQLVAARFEGLPEYLVQLAADMTEDIEQGGEGAIGKIAPQYQTAGALIYDFATGDPEATRALKAFASANDAYEGLGDVLKNIMEYFNVNPFKEIKAAKSIAELNHALVDLIDKLAKVVTNFSSVRVQTDVEATTDVLAINVATATIPEEGEQLGVLQGLAQDAPSAAQLRSILLDMVPHNDEYAERLEEPEFLARQFSDFMIEQLTQNILPVLGALLDVEETAENNFNVVLQFGGDLLAHESDGTLYLNVEALRHPAIALGQLEHEAGHEILARHRDETVAAPVLAGQDVAPDQLVPLIEELVVVNAEVERFERLDARTQNTVLETLQGPTPLDAQDTFWSLLQDVTENRLTNRVRMLRILDYIEATRPDLATENRFGILRALSGQELGALLVRMRALLPITANGNNLVEILSDAENSVGPVTPLAIHPGSLFDFGTTVADVGSRDVPLKLAGSVARTVTVGSRGAVSSDGSVLRDLPRVEKQNLASVGWHLIGGSYSTAAVDRSTKLLDLPNAERPESETRSAYVTLADGRVVQLIAMEAVKNHLTDNYGQSLAFGQTGAGTVAVVYNNSEARALRLPAELERNDQQVLAAQVVVSIPDHVQRDWDANGQMAVNLNPLPSMEVEEAEENTSAFERQLELYARANGIPLHEGRPDLRRVRVWHLQDRDREAPVFNVELQRLAESRGLQIQDPSDGTIAASLATAQVAPATGYSEEQPLEIFFGTTRINQAWAMQLATGGGALPANVAAGMRLLPPSVNDPGEIAKANLQNPIGGANNWSDALGDRINEWPVARTLGLTEGGTLLHTHIREAGASITLIIVPTTEMHVGFDVELVDDRGTKGIGGLTATNGGVEYHAIVAQSGALFVQTAETQVRQDVALTAFEPPPNVQITAAAERRAFDLRFGRISTNFRAAATSGVATETRLDESMMQAFVNATGGAFDRFTSDANMPQVVIHSHPNGNDDRFVVSVIADETPGFDLFDVVRSTFSAEGGKLEYETRERFRGNVGVIMIDVDRLKDADIRERVRSLRVYLRFRHLLLTQYFQQLDARYFTAEITDAILGAVQDQQRGGGDAFAANIGVNESDNLAILISAQEGGGLGALGAFAAPLIARYLGSVLPFPESPRLPFSASSVAILSQLANESVAELRNETLLVVGGFELSAVAEQLAGSPLEATLLPPMAKFASGTHLGSSPVTTNPLTYEVSRNDTDTVQQRLSTVFSGVELAFWGTDAESPNDGEMTFGIIGPGENPGVMVELAIPLKLAGKDVKGHGHDQQEVATLGWVFADMTDEELDRPQPGLNGISIREAIGHRVRAMNTADMSSLVDSFSGDPLALNPPATLVENLRASASNQNVVDFLTTVYATFVRLGQQPVAIVLDGSRFGLNRPVFTLTALGSSTETPDAAEIAQMLESRLGEVAGETGLTLQPEEPVVLTWQGQSDDHPTIFVMLDFESEAIQQMDAVVNGVFGALNDITYDPLTGLRESIRDSLRLPSPTDSKPEFTLPPALPDADAPDEEAPGQEEKEEPVAVVLPDPVVGTTTAPITGVLPATAAIGGEVADVTTTLSAPVVSATVDVVSATSPAAVNSTLPGVDRGPSVFVDDAYSGTALEIPASGVLVNGYSLPNGGIVPDALIDAGLVEPGATRLLVPSAVMDGSQHVYIQAGLLDSNLVTTLQAQGVAVTEFLLSDIPEPDTTASNIFIAAVPHDSANEARMASYGPLVNLFGSSPELRPTSVSGLATLIQAAWERGTLRVNAIFSDDVSGIIAIDLYA